MSKVVSIVIVLLWFTAAYSQSFKEVKTAADVVENYITAIGGTEKVSKITSVDMYCSLAGVDSSLMRLYMSKTVFYMNMKFRMLDVSMVYDFRKKSGWIETFGKVTNMNATDEKKSKEAVSSLMWDNYLNPSSNGLKYEFNSAVEQADTTCYAIDILKNDSLLLTAYIDKVSFMKLRESRGNSLESYGDFRENTAFGIIVPFLIGGKKGDKSELKVKKYVFNKRIDSDLIERPESNEE